MHASIITGGGRGIGRAIARRLAGDTAVVLVGRTEVDLISARADILGDGGSAEYVAGDVTDPDTAQRAISLVRKKGWTARNLICNAGIGKSGAFEMFDAATWKQIFEVNVYGTFYFFQACVSEMLIHGGGTICIMSSVAGLKGYPYNAAYVASKHALVGMARSLALEYRTRGITVVPVCPGFVESDMTERTIHGVMERRGMGYDEARTRVARANSQQRIILAEEVAETIANVCAGKVLSPGGEPLII